MKRLAPDLSPRKSAAWTLLSGAFIVAAVTGCTPSTTRPIGGTASTNLSVNYTSKTSSSWVPLSQSVALGMKSQKYQEKVTVNIQEGSILGGFTVYGRINPPNKASVAFHQNGYNMAFYQQGLSAYGDEDAHWQPTQALADLNLFPSYQHLVDTLKSASVPVFKLAPAQFVVDEYCDVYQATVPANLIGTLPTLGASYHPANTSAVVYTFYVGQKDGELRQVTTTSEGAVTGVGSVGVQTDTILFAINQQGSDISIDPNLYNTLLYQY